MAIETYSIDLTLNTDQFNKEADKARKKLYETFEDAKKSTKEFNAAFATFQKQWGLFRGTSLANKIKELQSMKGVTKEVSAELERVLKAVSDYSSGSGTKQAILASFSGVEAASDHSYKELYEERKAAENDIQRQIEHRIAIEDEANKRSEQALTDKNKAISDGLLKEAKEITSVDDALKEVSTEFYRQKVILEELSVKYKELKSDLKETKANAAEYFTANGIAFDSKTGLGSLDDPSLTEEQIEKVNQYNTAIRTIEESLRSLKETGKELKAGIKSASSEFTSIVNEQKKKIASLEEAANKSFSSVAGSVVSLLATVGATKFYKEAITAAGELEKSTQRLVNLFTTLGDEAVYSAQEISDAYGMSNKAASQTIGYVGNLMKAYGLTDKMALELAEGVTELSADLASFSGGTKTAEQAAQALSQALLGNYRATRDLGIAITDTEVKLMARSLDMNTEALTQGELALLRYKVVQEQTVNVVGDFARSQDTYYVATQRATAAVQDMKAVLGDDLLPIVTLAYNTFADFANLVGTLPGSLRTIITTTVILVATFATLRTVLKPVFTSMKEFKVKLIELVGAESALSASTGVLSKALVTLGNVVKSHPALLFASLIASTVTLISTLSLKNKQEELEATTLSIDKLSEAIRNYKNASSGVSRGDSVAKDIMGSALGVAAGDLIAQMESNTINLNKETEQYNKILADTEDEMQRLASLYYQIKDVEGDIKRDRLSYLSYGKKFSSLESDYLALIKQREEALKSLSELQNKYNADDKSGVLALAKAYRVNEESVSKQLEGHEEIAKEVKNIVEYYELMNEYGYTEEEILRAMNYEASGWSKEINSANEKLLDYQNKRLENEGEYRRAVLSSISVIEEERDARNKDIMGRALFEEQSLISSLKERSASVREGVREELRELIEQVNETGDVSDVEITLDNIEETYGLGEGTLDKFQALLKLMGDSFELFSKNKAIIEEEYAEKAYGINKDLHDRLQTLESNSNQTLEQQREASLAKLSETYQKFIDELYGRMGGDKGILGDFASDEDVAKLKDAIKAVKEGVEPILGPDGITLVGDLSFEGEKVKDFFDVLIQYYKAYREGQLNIDADYNKKIADAQAKQQQTLNTLNAELSKDREKIHQAELDNLEIEKERRLEAAKTSGEDITLIEEEYRLKRLQLEQDFADETAEIRREADRNYIEQKKGLTTDAKAIYDMELQLLDDELQYELEHIRETGKTELEIRRENALKRIEIEREAEDAIREERRKSVEDWKYGAVSQEDNFLGEGFESYYSMFTDFEDKFIEAKRDLQTRLSDGWDDIMKGAEGTEWEDDLKKIENAFTTAATDEDLLGIRTLIDELKVANPKLAEAIEEIIPEDAWDKTEKRNKQRAQVLANIINQTITKAIDALGKLLTAMEDAQMEETKRRISQMKEAYDDMKEQMEKRNDKANGRLTRSQKDAIERQKKMDEEELERQKALIEDQETLLKEQETEQFERQKAFSIATATITGIQAAINAYTAGMEMAKYMGAGAVAAPAIAAGMMAASLAATTAQIAMIASQQAPSYAQGAYNLPQDQTGVNVHKGEMIIPRPFAETLRSELSGNTSDASSGDIVINVYGTTDEVSVEDNSSEGNQQLDIYLTQRVKTMVARGELDNALQTRYSISKNGRMS